VSARRRGRRRHCGDARCASVSPADSGPWQKGPAHGDNPPPNVDWGRLFAEAVLLADSLELPDAEGLAQEGIAMLFEGQTPPVWSTFQHSGRAPKTRCRVAPGDRSPGAPTDPDVRDYRIRLVRARVRYVAYRRVMRGGGSGKRSSRSSSRCQSTYPVLERRESHLRQACRVSRKKRASAR
jgi:hypothetical protein